MDVRSSADFSRALEEKRQKIRVVGNYANELWRNYTDERIKQKDPRGYFRKALWADLGNWMSHYKVKSYREDELVFEAFPYHFYSC